ncbi:ABC transporter ATP-binding protein [Halopenitus persicus]|uniref:Molybdate/tungstate import ATP-binding protein WtpC n=1 Tax=Halopenitus persicus TaxID=1048396 RepID=A0A1H3HBH1_9EURY|nr:ABC transporter ATP-binding protein [Halopenitus persicus]QHS16058.1 ABC transporter ATP-binding protein [haloarchaeon 3A1-DGR]SDY11969.1 spermidine/putrescine transport system ATP-binding protein [Halopenitus persicus]
MTESDSRSVTVTELTKDFGDVRAVEDMAFEIEEGEFFSLLGPSGCGKTTTLRMIAGFERPTDGTVSIGDDDVTDRPPYERDVGMVFQSYALFPHKTVGENVGFGLKMEGVPEAERAERVADSLELVGLPGMEDRSPGELSGGQQQRVALARALVIEPSVLVLDEPISNLDLKLRKQMQFELKRIQTELGITTIYVTHDQEVALSLSDRLAVMNDGTAEQIGTPEEVYHEPTNRFVADFIGESNLLAGTVDAMDGTRATIALEDLPAGSVHASGDRLDGNVDAGDAVTLSVRPENLRMASAEPDGDVAVSGTIRSKTFQGKETTFLVDADGEEIVVETTGRESGTAFEAGDDVLVYWNAEDHVCLLEGQ